MHTRKPKSSTFPQIIPHMYFFKLCVIGAFLLFTGFSEINFKYPRLSSECMNISQLDYSTSLYANWLILTENVGFSATPKLLRVGRAAMVNVCLSHSRTLNERQIPNFEELQAASLTERAHETI